MNYLSFDIGATQTKYAVITDQFSILEKGEYPTNVSFGKKYILKSISDIVNKYQSFDIKGIAISSPGIIDNQTGVVLYANDRMPNYTNFNYKEELFNLTSLNCSVENDVNCFALAETLNIKASFIVITIGTGLGGAIVINEQIHHGVNNSAGEFGQMVIDSKKWEDLASMKSLVDKARLFNLQIKNGEELFVLYDQNNKTAMHIIDDFFHNFAKGICNLAYIFNPHYIIVGGGITNRGELFETKLNDAIKIIADQNYFGSTIVQISKFKNDGGIIGALIHHLKIYS